METVVGASGGKIGFYGATPVVQPAGADQAVVTWGTRMGRLAASRSPTRQRRLKSKPCATSAKSWPMTSGRCPRSFTPWGALVAVGVVKGGA